MPPAWYTISVITCGAIGKFSLLQWDPLRAPMSQTKNWYDYCHFLTHQGWSFNARGILFCLYWNSFTLGVKNITLKAIFPFAEVTLGEISCYVKVYSNVCFHWPESSFIGCIVNILKNITCDIKLKLEPRALLK